MKNHHDNCEHEHDHAHELPQKPGRAFQIAIVLNLLFVIVELYSGYISASLSLIGDALHNLGDVFSLVLAWLGFYLAKSVSTEKLTFGFRKVSILAAFLNALILILTSFYIIFKAIERFENPQSQNSLLMIGVSAVGFVINLSTALLFQGGHKHDLNLKSAYLHLLADAAVSMGVVLAGLLIYWKGYSYVDEVTSILIAAVILAGTWGLFKEAFVLLLNGVPQQIDYKGLLLFVKTFPSVKEVIELKVWAVSTSEFSMTAKLLADSKTLEFKNLQKEIEAKFHIKNITIQVN